MQEPAIKIPQTSLALTVNLFQYLGHQIHSQLRPNEDLWEILRQEVYICQRMESQE